MTLDGAFEPQEQQYGGSEDEQARATCWRCAEAQTWHYRHHPIDDRVNEARCPEHKGHVDH